jgi:NADH-quinone oxidoreductase subunit G
MEEAQELVEKLNKGDSEMPLFTSCCPAWIRFVETKHPELMKYVSTSKSPMEMFGAVIKDYYKKADEESGKKTVSIAVMPCTAKKYEAAREEFKKNGVPDVDYVITTQELARMIRELGIQFNEIEPSAPDMPFSISSGAGMIFGVTGGVSEAALRRVADNTPYALKEIEYSGVRGLDGVKSAYITLGDTALRVGVVSGLGNADALIEKIKSGEEHFDFVEVMACPMGCIAGAGQPFSYINAKRERAKGVYTTDKSAMVKRSNENPVVMDMYSTGVLKDHAHELLHVHYKTCEGK